MVSESAQIPDVRPLTEEERLLIRWLVENGDEEPESYLAQLDTLSVKSRCGCGCSSINFTEPFRPCCINGSVIADYRWNTLEGFANGVFLYQVGGELSGLEVWSIDGQQDPVTYLPGTSELWPMPQPTRRNRPNKSLVRTIISLRKIMAAQLKR